MDFLQRDLDFSRYDATNDDLLAYWTRHDRPVRSHRRPHAGLRHAVLTALVVVLGATMLGTGLAALNGADNDYGRATAASAPPESTPQAPVEVTDPVEQVELRGGDRASRTGDRAPAPRMTRSTAPRQVERPRPTSVEASPTARPETGKTPAPSSPPLPVDEAAQDETEDEPAVTPEDTGGRERRRCVRRAWRIADGDEEKARALIARCEERAGTTTGKPSG